MYMVHVLSFGRVLGKVLGGFLALLFLLQNHLQSGLSGVVFPIPPCAFSWASHLPFFLPMHSQQLQSAESPKRKTWNAGFAGGLCSCNLLREASSIAS